MQLVTPHKATNTNANNIFFIVGRVSRAETLADSRLLPSIDKRTPAIDLVNRLTPPSTPRRGRERIAQGKGAYRLPPWVTAPPAPNPSSWSAVPAARLARQTMKRGDIYYGCSVTQGGASLALGWYLSPLRGFLFCLALL